MAPSRSSSRPGQVVAVSPTTQTVLPRTTGRHYSENYHPITEQNDRNLHQNTQHFAHRIKKPIPHHNKQYRPSRFSSLPSTPLDAGSPNSSMTSDISSRSCALPSNNNASSTSLALRSTFSSLNSTSLPLPDYSDILVPTSSLPARTDYIIEAPMCAADCISILPRPSDKPFGYENGQVPWATKRYSIGIKGLHEELIDLYRYLRPSSLEELIRKQVFDKVHSIIATKWADYSVSVSMFGSLRTRLFLPSSDIDVLVECSDWNVAPLNETADALRESGIARDIHVYADAFVPIVKMVDKETNISVDISFNTVQSVRAAEYIENVKFEFPVIEPLILILKQFLHQRRLNQTYMGGLSSYGLLLMLIHFLQGYYICLRQVAIYDERINLGELLIRFFEVFSQEFNFHKVGISVREIRYTQKVDDSSLVLSLEDPLLSCNEVGRSSYNYMMVSRAFEQAHRILSGILLHARDETRMSPRELKLWGKHYSGSMMQYVMPFSQKEITRRDWLRGFVLEFKCEPESSASERSVPVSTVTLVYNSFLAKPFDLSRYDWVKSAIPTTEAKSHTRSLLPITYDIMS